MSSTAPTPDSFRAQREAAQARLRSTGHLGIDRFLTLDTGAYRDRTSDGGLDGGTKELLGLVASMVLRCDDCINYHTEQCVRAGYTVAQITDAMNIALIVGGSIVIPHMRRALLMLDQFAAEGGSSEKQG
ncbi:MAG: carboxymuconolactone decarboxylase family protein [Phycisphaerales bacterium]|nr:carboxymuconolactone decarboxylase family protein [Phycisphaerales bacterium]